MSSMIAIAVVRPSTASSQSDIRHGVSMSRAEINAGMAALPRSPVKL
jgi:hypothetical protein